MDNERSIPSAIDGLKPGQRKVLYTCLKRNDKREVKVAQLVGSVAEQSAYHHGEAALAGTIVGLAQNFVGSNNINLLLPIGQFGTRLQGGKDAASPRYIFTLLSPMSKHMFPILDNPLLHSLYDDNLKIEPEYYVPIIPSVLVNGAEGIGTGWSTKVPNFNPRDLVENIYRMLEGDEPMTMSPWYKNFRGSIERLDDQHFLVSGEVAILENNKIEITELPVRHWTQAYKENVLEPMVHGSDKTPASITDYKEYHTDTTVRFVVTMTPDKFNQARNQGFHKFFKLQSSIALSSMVLFDNMGCLRKYDNPEQILKEFFEVRLALYERRKEYMVGILEAESLKLKNQARFILEKIENKITVENRKKVDMIKALVDKGYDSDPVKAWKETQKEVDAEEKEEDVDNEKDDTNGPDYDYILGMTMWSLTRERKDELLKKRDEKVRELEDLRKKTPSDLWKNDLKDFLEELDKVEKHEREDEAGEPKLKKKGGGGKKNKFEDKPSPFGERVSPPVDEEFKKKWEKKPTVPGEAKKGRKKKAEVKKEDEEENGKDISLSERIKEASPSKKEKGGKGKMKQTTLTFTSIGEKKRPGKSPKKNKKNPWSESESNDEPSDLSDMEVADDYIPPEKRETAPRRAAAKAKYIFDSDEENPMKSSGGSEDEGSNSNTRVSSPLPTTNNNSKPEKEELNGNVSPVISDSDDSFSPETENNKQSHDDLFDSLLGGKSEEKPPEKTVVVPKRKASSDSDSSEGFKIEAEKPKPKAAPKKKPRKKSDDSGSEDEFMPKEKKETVPKEKKAAVPRKKAPPKEAKKPKAHKPKSKKKSFDDSDDDFDALLSGADGVKKSKAPKAKPKKKSFDGSDDEFDAPISEGDDMPPVQPRSGRAKAPTKFTFSSESEDDDF